MNWKPSLESRLASHHSHYDMAELEYKIDQIIDSMTQFSDLREYAIETLFSKINKPYTDGLKEIFMLKSKRIQQLNDINIEKKLMQQNERELTVLLEKKLSLLRLEQIKSNIKTLNEDIDLMKQLWEYEEENWKRMVFKRSKTQELVEMTERSLEKDVAKLEEYKMNGISIPNQCPICFDNQRDKVLQCGHPFCSNCIEEFIKYECPTCRSPIDKRKALKFYF